MLANARNNPNLAHFKPAKRTIVSDNHLLQSRKDEFCMIKADGMNYAPKGKPNPVVEEGEFKFAAVALDHGHIYGMCNGLIEAGATLTWVYDPEIGRAH